MRPTRILVADPDPLARRATCDLLAADPELEVVGEVDAAHRVPDLVERLRPCILLLADTFPGPRVVVDLTAAVRRSATPTRIVILALAPQWSTIVEALRAGAGGALLKEREMEQLGPRLRRFAVEGEAPIAPCLAAMLIGQVRLGPDRADQEPSDGLTPRERDVLQLLGQGLGNADIATCLSVSRATVKTHVHNLLAKLHARSRVELALKANALYGGPPEAEGLRIASVRAPRPTTAVTGRWERARRPA